VEVLVIPPTGSRAHFISGSGKTLAAGGVLSLAPYRRLFSLSLPFGYYIIPYSRKK